MPHPLLERLATDLGWQVCDDPEALSAFADRPGEHMLLIPGDPAKNLETTDAAVVAPELAQAFQHRFDCAVVLTPQDRPVREAVDVWQTPALVFFREGRQIGAIPKIRDWDDYIARARLILDGAAMPAPASVH